jgi:hypothetical protein
MKFPRMLSILYLLGSLDSAETDPTWDLYSLNEWQERKLLS